ncbi:MAG: hypothetical protein AB8E82_02660 [Aureispira sp.]
MEIDTSQYAHSLSWWDASLPEKEEVFNYYKIIIKNKKNSIHVYPTISKVSYTLTDKLKGKALAVQDSIVQDALLHRYNRGPTHLKLFEVSSIMFVSNKYIYCDLEYLSRYYSSQYQERLFDAQWSRVFMIEGIFYEFIVISHEDYSKRCEQSKRAVKCAFECLMKTIRIKDD